MQSFFISTKINRRKIIAHLFSELYPLVVESSTHFKKRGAFRKALRVGNENKQKIMEEYYEPKWHENPRNVILLLIFFFPLGLYFMWKHEMWTQNTRWIVTGILALLVISDFFIEDDFGANSEFINVSPYEANIFAKTLASEMGQEIQESYEYNTDDGHRVYIYFSGNTYTNSACIFMVRAMELDLWKHECGTFEGKKYAFNTFIDGLQ